MEPPGARPLSASLFHLLEVLGLAVFAASGVLTARRKSLDLFGVVVVAAVTAIGGGTLRDLLLDRRPIFWVADPRPLIVILMATAAALVFTSLRRPKGNAFLVADALGLALFSITGAQIAREVGASSLIVVVMGTMTGVAGGAIRDVLCAEIPLILRRHIYATAAIAGTAAYVGLEAAGLPGPVPVLLGSATVLALRLAAIYRGLHLPGLPTLDVADEEKR